MYTRRGHRETPLGTPQTSAAYFLTVSVADIETPPPVAAMSTVVFAVTLYVAIDAVADFAPAGTTTLVLAATAGLALVSVTRRPPAGAGPFSVTLADAAVPPFTPAPGASVSPDTAGGLTVSDDPAVVPP